MGRVPVPPIPQYSIFNSCYLLTAVATSSPLPLQRPFGETTRRDAWWLPSAVTFLGFTAFIIYSTWAGFSNANYECGPYLSPMYSPLLFGPSAHSWFGGPAQPTWWPPFLHFSAAALILWGPVGFRLTCYYYRGAYYKAFWADPPGCAVGEPRKKYLGERWFPLVIQNIHRYFLYVAILFICILTYDAWVAMWFPADGSTVLERGRADRVRHRRRHARAVAQRGVPGLLHVRLPLAAAPGRRRARRDVGAARAQDGLRLRELPEPRGT